MIHRKETNVKGWELRGQLLDFLHMVEQDLARRSIKLTREDVIKLGKEGKLTTPDGYSLEVLHG